MKALSEQINELDGIAIYGPLHAMSVGARVVIETSANDIPCEVVVSTSDEPALMRLQAAHVTLACAGPRG